MGPLLEPLYRQYFRRPIAYAHFFGSYPTFDDALAASPGTLPSTFDTADAAQMYLDRLDRLHPEDYPVAFWLQRSLRRGLRIFDLGGHVGIARHAFGRILPLDETEWVCQDLPAVAENGRAILAKRPVPGLSFTSDEADGDGADLWLALGSLQYLRWDLGDRLSSLERSPQTVIINKLPVHPTFGGYTLQNVGTAICPYRVFADQPFVTAMRTAGYVLREKWKNPGLSCSIPFHADLSVPVYTGYWFEREATL